MANDMLVVPWDKEPDFVNEQGTKWWKDHYLTEYANDVDCTVWFVETCTGGRTRILVSHNGHALYDDTNLEGMCCHIDMLKIEKRFMA